MHHLTLWLVKSGTDITVDSSGNVSVNDDSHNHVISNVDGLQNELDGKAASSHSHNYIHIRNPFHPKYYVNSLHLIVISRKGSEFIVTLTEWKHKSVKITDVHMLIQR